ncbi:GNAT family N-acyltransferase [Haliea salexigens]|uniref:GNAT family N-acyltransferase n=1 Tax=Haliea salexigens TaxID=287487 RepID=UPI00041BA20B|nr:lysophospholipid acyltransferase family protein [Haliea salexigens]
MLDIREILQARYPRFVARHQRMARSLMRFLGYLFYESRFAQFSRDFPGLEGMAFVHGALEYFDFAINISPRERSRIPAKGRVVIIANHPLGSLDGLALLQQVGQIRSDVKVVANDLLTAVKPLAPLLLPVNNMGGTTSRENLKCIRRHLAKEGALIIFPAGEVSRFGVKGVKDGEWQHGFVRIANTAQAPILPIYVAGRNSVLFYSLSFLSRPLSTLWLVREMFHQAHNTVEARVGAPIPWENYHTVSTSPRTLAGQFRRHVYRLARNAPPIFRGVEAIAEPENRMLLEQEVIASELLGCTPDGMQIHLCKMERAPCTMREIGRLRELAFRAVGEGSGLPRDIDRFDQNYLQLVLWDPDNREIAGAYRLGRVRELLALGGKSALYTHALFRLGGSMDQYLQHGLELGRSFVQAQYQTRHSLDYLWLGIGAYLRRYPGCRYLFGAASISPLYGEVATAQICGYYAAYCRNETVDVRPRHPYRPEHEYSPSGNAEHDFRALRDALAENGLQVPTLFKHYANVAEPGGVAMTAFNVDASFGNCVDAFVMVDLERLKPRKKQRYLQAPPIH